MRCRECEKKLSAYIDDRLDPTGRREMQEHLEWCDECMRSYRLLRAAGQSLAANDRAEVPSGLAERAVEAAFAHRAAKKPAAEQPAGLLDGLLALRWPGLATVAASLIAALLLALSAGVFDGTTGKRKPAAPTDPVATVASVADLDIDRVGTVAAVLGQREEE
jgi:anti-sigma factor RsiW